ncbi:hypothetical protein Poli38472_002007 [Pythium oligandrum]|uniref:Uncharacterized protein n=1 Tax=Pythium oligandrum TaxID=41045 RepID=A0A8K1CWF3_PYTOL|nr:hypothetical protein Poli38472_002007 [Pythium oligandrum]|eukprot:TMW69851.1 hypothetical protein Poli38472_002007 [Pythium oligandrum]
MMRHAIMAAAALLVAFSATEQVEAASLRRSTETWRLLEQTTEAASDLPLTEKTVQWLATAKEAEFVSKPIGKLVGDEAIVVFHDRDIDLDVGAEVSFNVRSSANCVVSVCGEMRRWLIRSSEQCWELKIAPKSSDPEKNGLIEGISAAYTADRPVANKLYLKFDAINYIDGSPCEYEIVSGSKKNASDVVVTARS